MGASRSELIALLESQQYCCALSGLPLTPDTVEIDHINPKSEGGSHGLENLQWVHADINEMKRTLPQGRFVALCRLVASAGSDDNEEAW